MLVAVQEFYCSAGLYYDEMQSELANHISFELTAMATLARAEAEARVTSDRLDVQQRVRDQAEFLACHLGHWGIDLGRWVALRARTPFYREAG